MQPGPGDDAEVQRRGRQHGGALPRLLPPRQLPGQQVRLGGTGVRWSAAAGPPALARLLAWHWAPNGRHAHFFNVWAGRRRRARFQARLRADLGQVLALLADGTLTAQVAARLPLQDADAAMLLAESRTVVGKVVLVPGTGPAAT